MSDIHVILKVDPEQIEAFHTDSQEGQDWGNINFPFDANSLVINTGTYAGTWYQQLSAGQIMKFKLDNDHLSHELRIEFIRLNPLGTIDYHLLNPTEAWASIVNPGATQGAIGDYGAYFLTPDRPGASNPSYSLVGSDELADNSPNLSYTILFSFVGTTGKRHYCSIDPLIKTSSVHTPPEY